MAFSLAFSCFPIQPRVLEAESPVPLKLRKAIECLRIDMID